VFHTRKGQTLLVLAAGALLGYGAASGRVLWNRPAEAAPGSPADNSGADCPACCSEGVGKGALLARADTKEKTVLTKADEKNGKKPNILVLWGDDIGYWNLSAYNHGAMGYRTPNIDRIAKEGALFTDCYAHQSYTSGRAGLHIRATLRSSAKETQRYVLRSDRPARAS
jgi:arylsulfatase